MSKWLWLFLRGYVVVGLSLMGNETLSDVEVDFNEEKSRMVHDILKEELFNNTCQASARKKSFPYLYFHVDYERWSIYASNLKTPNSQCFVANGIDSDILGSRITLDLTFPNIVILGKLTCSYIHDTPFNLNVFEEVYDCDFRLAMYNVTGHGICFSKWTENSYGISDCNVHFQKPPLGNLRFTNFECDQRGKELLRLTSRDYFRHLMMMKFWRSIFNQLNLNVKEKINNLLKRKNIANYLKDIVVFEKYQNYVIESTQSANEFVDSIMGGIKKILIDRFHDKVKIPNITEGFSRKGIFVTWRGSFFADHGTVRGLATVSRTGDTTFAVDNSSQTHFFGNLTFHHLDLHYERYKAEFMGLGPTGTLSTILRPIRLYIHPYVNFNTKKVYLEDFKIKEVGELEVEVTGLGPILNWLVSKITTWVVGMTRDKILDDLQNKYDNYIKSILSGYSIDDIIQGKVFDGPK